MFEHNSSPTNPSQIKLRSISQYKQRNTQYLSPQRRTQFISLTGLSTIPPTWTRHNLLMLQLIDRVLYHRLIDIVADAKESMKVMASWMQLEAQGFNRQLLAMVAEVTETILEALDLFQHTNFAKFLSTHCPYFEPHLGP